MEPGSRRRRADERIGSKNRVCPADMGSVEVDAGSDPGNTKFVGGGGRVAASVLSNDSWLVARGIPADAMVRCIDRTGCPSAGCCAPTASASASVRAETGRVANSPVNRSSPRPDAARLSCPGDVAFWFAATVSPACLPGVDGRTGIRLGEGKRSVATDADSRPVLA